MLFYLALILSMSGNDTVRARRRDQAAISSRVSSDNVRVYTVPRTAMAAGGGNLKVIPNDSEFQKELIVVGDKLVVVDFFATWYFYFLVLFK